MKYPNHTLFSNINLLPFQVISYMKNPYQVGIFNIVQYSRGYLRVESMNSNSRPFIHDFVAVDSIDFPVKGWNYILYGNSIQESSLKPFTIIDEGNRYYYAHLPKYVKENDKLWVVDYNEYTKITLTHSIGPQMV
jgi:hypothetical protein